MHRCATTALKAWHGRLAPSIATLVAAFTQLQRVGQKTANSSDRDRLGDPAWLAIASTARNVWRCSWSRPSGGSRWGILPVDIATVRRWGIFWARAQRGRSSGWRVICHNISRRQPGAPGLGSQLRRALRRKPDTRFIRQDDTPPSQPRRGPGGQQRLAHHRHRSAPNRRTNKDLCCQAHRRRALKARGDPLPSNATSPARSSPCSAAANARSTKPNSPLDT